MYQYAIKFGALTVVLSTNIIILPHAWLTSKIMFLPCPYICLFPLANISTTYKSYRCAIAREITIREDYPLIKTTSGDPKTHCRVVVEVANVSKAAGYDVTVHLFTNSSRSNQIGIIYNVRDENNFDLLLFRRVYCYSVIYSCVFIDSLVLYWVFLFVSVNNLIAFLFYIRIRIYIY